MPVYKMTDIPKEELQAVIDDFELEGYVTKTIKQANGLYTVEAKKEKSGEVSTETGTGTTNSESEADTGASNTQSGSDIPATEVKIPKDLLRRLVVVYKGENIRHPILKPVTLAQWMLESGRATSKLATEHYNFGGLKWRIEMRPYAKKVSYNAHDGTDNYCKFPSLESFINGYWAFLNRSPYSGWEEHTGSAEEFINFIGPIYTPSAGYAEKVLALLPEAELLLAGISNQPETSNSSNGVDLGTLIIDPGHGGTKNVAGSSANNAIARSGTKEKKLTLDFAMILQNSLISQANTANEKINVVLTRSHDVNVTGAKRAGMAFSHKAKAFLSIHFNGSKTASIRGTETFYRAKANGNLNLEDDIAFAKIIQDSVYTSLKNLDAKSKNRKVKPDTKTYHKVLGVLNDKRLGNHKRPKNDRCTSALLEIEFISNPGADRLLVSGADAISNRQKVLDELATAIRGYMKN